jgi:hypothetical protein
MQQDRHLSIRKGTNLPNEVTSLLQSLEPSPKGDLNREVPLWLNVPGSMLDT